MTEHLTVAACIPTIMGRDEMLERAIASVEAQTRPPEYLVVNVDTERRGAAWNRNQLLERAVEQGADLIAWLDDDDEFMPNHIERLARVLEAAEGIDLVYPIPKIIGGRDPTATSLNGVWVLPWHVEFGPEQEEHLRNLGSFIPITHLVRTATVQRAGGFPQPGSEEWPRPGTEDWGYLVKLLNAGAKFYHLPVVTWLWNGYHGSNTGGQPDGTPLW